MSGEKFSTGNVFFRKMKKRKCTVFTDFSEKTPKSPLNTPSKMGQNRLFFEVFYPKISIKIKKIKFFLIDYQLDKRKIKKK